MYRKILRLMRTILTSKCVSEKGAYYTHVINFLKSYRNVIIVPAAVAMLLEWHNGREQSSCSSVWRRLSYDVTLTAVMLTTHTLTVLGIHIAHLAYIKAILITPRETTHSKVLFPGRPASTLAHPQQWKTCCVISRLTLH